MELTNRDLGVWFGVNGVSIKSQMELDFAIISLANNYGYVELEVEELRYFYTYFYIRGEEGDNDTEEILMYYGQRALKFLNEMAEQQGYKFDFGGEEYDTLVLQVA